MVFIRVRYALIVAALPALLLAAMLSYAQDTTPGGTQQQGNPLDSSPSMSYTVQQSDTLDRIGATYDVQPACIAKDNSLADPNLIRPGDVLILNATCPRYDGFDGVRNPRQSAAAAGQGGGSTDTSGQGGGGNTYTVKVADTLDEIAQQYNISVISLELANSITDARKVFPGTVLTIPTDAPPYGSIPPLSQPASAAQSPSSEATSEAGQGGGSFAQPAGNTYTVQVADTLDTIAQQFNISVISLEQTNGITNPLTVMPGTVLIIPTDAPPYGSIPPLTSPVTAPQATAEVGGQGGGVTPPLGQGGGGTTTSVPAGGYVVQTGDVLDLIALRFNKQLSCLAQQNNITDPNTLKPGQIVMVNVNCLPYDGFSTISPTATPEASPAASGNLG